MSEEKNLFDPENYQVSTPLSGALGTIKEAVLIRHNYGGKSSVEQTALQVTVVAEHLEHERVNIYSCGQAGGLYPSEDGKTRSQVGHFFVGTPTKGTNYAAFMDAVKKSGFPLEQFKEKGFGALEGEQFIWSAIERKVQGEMKAYEVPATHVVNEVDLPGGNSELEETVRAAVLKALEATPEIPRGQITVKVGPLLNGLTNRSAATPLLYSDSFLASIPGVSFDKKTLRKAA